MTRDVGPDPRGASPMLCPSCEEQWFRPYPGQRICRTCYRERRKATRDRRRAAEAERRQA